MLRYSPSFRVSLNIYSVGRISYNDNFIQWHDLRDYIEWVPLRLPFVLDPLSHGSINLYNTNASQCFQSWYMFLPASGIHEGFISPSF